MIAPSNVATIQRWRLSHWSDFVK